MACSGRSSAETPSFKTINQHLRLAKESYVQDDTLCAEFDLRFRVAFPVAGESAKWTLQGTVCEVIHAKDFNPFSVENFMMFDLPDGPPRDG